MSIFDSLVDRYDKWFENHPLIFESELNIYKEFLKKEKNGIEIGIGTGRFASAVGTEIGVDNSIEMLKFAKKRNIEVILADAMKLPFMNGVFNYASMVVTICFLNDLTSSLNEIKRILKHNGKLFIGIIDKESIWGKYYEKIKDENPFYKYAKFYTPNEIIDKIEKLNFKYLRSGQTLFHEPENEILDGWKNGYGEGAFVLMEFKVNE